MNMYSRPAGKRSTQASYLRIADRELPRFPLPRRAKQRSWAERNSMAMRLAIVAAIAITVGAGLAMLFDPMAGRRRRARSRDKMAKAWHRGAKRATRTGRYSAGFVRGRSQRVAHSIRPHHYDNSDQVVLDRIESMVFRDPEVPKGALNIDVVDRCAVIRGAVSSPYWIREVERRVLEIPGVERVENLLHMAGTKAPNKADALEASGHPWQERAISRN